MTLNPVAFLLNSDPDAAARSTVTANAFSLTKVLATAATIVAPITAFLVTKWSSIDLSAGQIVALSLGVLGFLAVASAADVLARSIGAAAEAKAGVLTFAQPLPGQRLIRDGQSQPADVAVLAVSQGRPVRFLVREGDEIAWVIEADIVVPKPAA